MNHTKYLNFGDDPFDNDISDIVQQSLENYLCFGLGPGSFLTGVLTNDLVQAVNSADHWNKTRIVQISKWVQHNAPALSWGSYEKMAAWLGDENYIRTSWFDPIEKKYVWELLQA
jgi:hypothetical protein